LTRVAGSSVGAYAINQGTLSAGNNYTLTFVGSNLTITAAPLTVKANNATMTYGGPLPVLSGVLTGVVNSDSVSASYSTTATTVSPVNASGYPITATLTGSALGNYAVTNTPGTLTITKATATVVLSNLSQTYTGQPLAATATTTPAGLAVTLTYNGAASTPTTVGSYTVVATINDANYIGAATGTLTITDAGQTITLGSGTTGYASGVVFGTAPLTLSAKGGASGNPVVFTLVSGPATLSGNMLTITGAGTVVIAANQAGNTDYSTAPTVTESIVIQQALPSVNTTLNTATTFLSNAVTITATITSTAGTPTGSVTFVDGASVLGTATLVNGSAALTTAKLNAGSHSIVVNYSGDVNFLTAASVALSEYVEDFTVSLGAGNVVQTVVPGSATEFTFSVTPPAGTTIPADINFSITGLPAGSSYSFLPATLPAGSAATNVTLTITLPQTAALARPAQSSGKNLSGHLMPLALGLLLLPFAGRLRRSSKRFHRAMMVLLLMGAGLAATLGVSGCGASSGYFGQQQQTYTVNVTATSGALSHSSTFTLIVE
jgi:hypothetical protein